MSLKNKWFKFHYIAWVTQAAGLTPSERGVLITLLVEECRKNGFTKYDPVRNGRMCGCSRSAFLKIYNRLELFGYVYVENCIIYTNLHKIFAAMDNKKRDSIPKKIRNLVFNRDGKICVYCGDIDGPFHLDHIFPWSMGGDNSAENLTVSCAGCNLSKGSKTLEEWRGKLL